MVVWEDEEDEEEEDDEDERTMTRESGWMMGGKLLIGQEQHGITFRDATVFDQT